MRKIEPKIHIREGNDPLEATIDELETVIRSCNVISDDPNLWKREYVLSAFTKDRSDHFQELSDGKKVVFTIDVDYRKSGEHYYCVTLREYSDDGYRYGKVGFPSSHAGFMQEEIDAYLANKTA